MKILGIDVSGNWKEGKGTSGLCFMKDGEVEMLSELRAKQYNSPEEYWKAHVMLLKIEKPDIVVMEGYRLYNHKGMQASTQANSELETPQLIGVIKVACHSLGIPLIIQYAHEVKSRWDEKVLVHKGLLSEKGNKYYFNSKQTNPHQRDAMKHVLHYWRYKHGKETTT